MAELLNRERQALLESTHDVQSGSQRVLEEPFIESLNPSYTPVWPKSGDNDLERVLLTTCETRAKEAYSQLAPWSKIGVGLWGNGNGFMPGYSPVQGGLSHELIALQQLTRRIRVSQQTGLVCDVIRTMAKHGVYSDEDIVDLLGALKHWRGIWRDPNPEWMESLSCEIGVAGVARQWHELANCNRSLRQLCEKARGGPAAGNSKLGQRLFLIELLAAECSASCDIAVKAIRANERVLQGQDKRIFARVLRVGASVSVGLDQSSDGLEVAESVENLNGAEYLAVAWKGRGHR